MYETENRLKRMQKERKHLNKQKRKGTLAHREESRLARLEGRIQKYAERSVYEE